VGIQTAQYTPPPSFLKKYAFLKFPIFQNQEKSKKSSRKGPYTLLWSLEGPSTTLVDMQTAQDTLVSAFFVTDVRHAFVAVHILLEWEISRKSSGKAYFTAVLGVRIQPRTLWWISILFRTPCQPHSKSGGTHFLQKISVSALQGTVTHARNPQPTRPHTYSDNTATAVATVSNEQLMALFEKPATAKRFVDTCYSSLFYKRTPRHVRNPLSFQVSPRAKQYQTKSPARSAISLHTAIAFKDAPEPEGRRRGN